MLNPAASHSPTPAHRFDLWDWSVGEVATPLWGRALVKHLKAAAQNNWSVCHNVYSSICKGRMGSCWMKRVIITAWMCEKDEMNSACLTIHTVSCTQIRPYHQHNESCMILFSSIFEGEPATRFGPVWPILFIWRYLTACLKHVGITVRGRKKRGQRVLLSNPVLFCATHPTFSSTFLSHTIGQVSVS